jgi:hypothetical protein
MDRFLFPHTTSRRRGFEANAALFKGQARDRDRSTTPEFKGRSQRCRFTERIVAPWPAVIDQ